MKGWLRRIRGAIGMGLTWAVAWSPIGAGMAWVLGFFFRGVEMGEWVGLFAVLGLVGGAVFSTVIRLTEGRRRFDELSLPRFAAFGALGGLLLGGLAFGAGVLGSSLELLEIVTISVTTLLAAGSAVGTLALARIADNQDLLEAGADTANAGRTNDEAQRLLGGKG
jgi:hypothetical protein